MAITRENVLSAIHKAKPDQDIGKLRDGLKLSDQGIDSLELFTLLLVLCESYGIEIPDADVDRLESITSIVAYFNHRLA